MQTTLPHIVKCALQLPKLLPTGITFDGKALPLPLPGSTDVLCRAVPLLVTDAKDKQMPTRAVVQRPLIQSLLAHVFLGTLPTPLSRDNLPGNNCFGLLTSGKHSPQARNAPSVRPPAHSTHKRGIYYSRAWQ